MNKSPSYKSALNIMNGIEQPSQFNDELVNKLKKKKSKNLSPKEYVEGILSRNRTILSQAITLIESSLKAHQEKAQEIIAECLKRSTKSEGQSTKSEGQSTKSEGRRTKTEYFSEKRTTNNEQPEASRQSAASIRIGITGVPGVGKSMFIEALGKYLTGNGHKVAVLAIDPSSIKSKGSILGDKTRMEELAVDPNAFIRPSPSAGTLGGVARKTRETIILCEAAGFDVIFVETVGVGQSETAVHSMVDFFLLLMLAGAGDELQGIKRGIIEMADAIIINKADGDNIEKANRAMAEYTHALHLYPPTGSGWSPVVSTCSSRTGAGIREVWENIITYKEITQQNGFFHHNREEQRMQTFSEAIDEILKSDFFSQRNIQSLLKEYEVSINNGVLTPYVAAKDLLDQYRKILAKKE